MEWPMQPYFLMLWNTMQAAARKNGCLAKAIKLPVTGNLDEDKLLLAKELKRLTTELGIKTLEEQGIKKEDFDMLADDVLKEPVLGFNPRQNITKEDILAILEKAF